MLGGHELTFSSHATNRPKFACELGFFFLLPGTSAAGVSPPAFDPRCFAYHVTRCFDPQAGHDASRSAAHVDGGAAARETEPLEEAHSARMTPRKELFLLRLAQLSDRSPR